MCFTSIGYFIMTHTPTTSRLTIAGLAVDPHLVHFIAQAVLPGLNIAPQPFWAGFSALAHDLAPVNKALLDRRDDLQRQIDDWHRQHRGKTHDPQSYQDFLTSIGYLEPIPEHVAITTAHVDPEIAEIAGPQLVVPVMNARYALNAANASWGSLYDALYGTDAIAIEGAAPVKGYDPARGAKVIARGRDILDQSAPLAQGSHHDACRYVIAAGQLLVHLTDGRTSALREPSQCVGFNGLSDCPTSILLRKHGLHLDIIIDPTHRIGQTDTAHIADIIVESALTAIMDCEDSVAAVDAEDKIQIYRNWLGLMKGDLCESFEKNGKIIERKLNQDRHWQDLNGGTVCLSGRSLMLVRNVGHLMTNPAILLPNGQEIPEGIMDAVITATIALHDLRAAHPVNSKTQSLYIVKPKMHGPQ